LRAYGKVGKADDPTKPDDFVLVAEQFAEDLSEASAPIDQRTVDRAVQMLDVNWTNMSLDQVAAVILAVSKLFTAAGVEVADLVRAPTAASLADLINGTAQATSDRLPSTPGVLGFGGGGSSGGGGVLGGLFGTPGAGVTASFDAQHPGIANNILRSQSIYVTDEYKRHSTAFSSTARKIVADGLQSGLRAEYITEDLVKAATLAGIDKPKSYWGIYSYATMNRARTNTQLVTFKEAGFTHYRFVAVMDERTTDICRALHGKVWEVSVALQKFNQVDMASGYTHDAVKDILPWVRNRPLADGTTEMYVKYLDGSEFQVGVIGRSGVGNIDDAGDYVKLASSASLASAGIMMPPLHGFCRSTVEVDF
jgi:SPP1 gp7 family putative phage head morphogenesis protein